MREIGDEVVSGDETLWRYFRPARFLSTLKERRLYFASANEFTDRFEGAVAVQMNAPPPDPRYAEMEGGERAFFELKRLTKISCWHRAAYESDAMWKHKGVRFAQRPIGCARRSSRFGSNLNMASKIYGAARFNMSTSPR